MIKQNHKSSSLIFLGWQEYMLSTVMRNRGRNLIAEKYLWKASNTLLSN